MGAGNAIGAEACVSGSEVLPGLYTDACGESGPPSLLQ